ncbi:MAG TPA: hypothetical protein ENK82_05480, partial [Campylobacterales bacterium]|nr:hypothetical protein [Campylobacterales bacterium]
MQKPNYLLPITLSYQPKILLVGSFLFGLLGLGVLYLFFITSPKDYLLLGSANFLILLALFSLYIHFKPTQVILDEEGIHIVRMKSQTIRWDEIAAISNFRTLITYQPTELSCKKEVVG